MPAAGVTSLHSAKPEPQLTEKGRRTRARLLKAARAVFERDGFISVRVADIVAEAKVAHGTFYLYFTSKEDIFTAVILAYQESIAAAARVGSDRQETTAYRTIEAANRSYIEGWARHYRLQQAWGVAAGLHADIARLLDQQIELSIARIERSLRRMQAANQVAADIDPGYAARALSSMVMQFCIRTFRDGPDGVDIDIAVRTVTDIWTRGIGLDASAIHRLQVRR